MSDPTTEDFGDGPRFADLIGLEFTDRSNGDSVCQLDVTDDLRNPHDVVHGSVLHAMADTGMGSALYPGLGEDELCATIEISMRYLRPVRDGTIRCETTTIHRGKTIAHLASEIRSGGELVARATGSYSIFTP